MATTTDPNDERLLKIRENGQQEVYLVLSEGERALGFVRPLRKSYKHGTCGAVTTMADDIAATYARNPKFYGSTYCCKCKTHLPVAEFFWDGTGIHVGE